ncbi:MAG: hypothetical protein ACHBNF_22185 [Chromatiales bacterium]
MLDSSRAQPSSTLPFDEKGRLKSLFAQAVQGAFAIESTVPGGTRMAVRLPGSA